MQFSGGPHRPRWFGRAIAVESLALFRITRDAEAESPGGHAGIIRLPGEASRGAQAGSGVVPGSPAEHTRCTPLRPRGIDAGGRVVQAVPVPAPFPDVPVHVVEAEIVGGPASDRLD